MSLHPLFRHRRLMIHCSMNTQHTAVCCIWCRRLVKVRMLTHQVALPMTSPPLNNVFSVKPHRIHFIPVFFNQCHTWNLCPDLWIKWNHAVEMSLAHQWPLLSISQVSISCCIHLTRCIGSYAIYSMCSLHYVPTIYHVCIQAWVFSIVTDDAH